ncbi:peptidylprolyl isomerase [Gillisia sp. Hel1_33_143]|nr:peptidylprolyl isomerase [Gillisia sp. Hel1_33_143]
MASCEDTQKTKKINTQDPVSTSVTKKEPVKEVAKNKDIDSIDILTKRDKPMLVQEELIPFLTDYGKKNPETKVRIITRFGNIDVELFKDTPLHRANFIFLAKHGYFDGTFFHRVAKGFVIQGGNSDNPETALKRNNIGSYLIPSETSARHTHNRGSFSAAKYAEQNVSDASSPVEFFIVQDHRGAHHLDNEHTVYGKVVKGMDVVDEINNQEVGQGEWPLINITIKVEVLE